TSRSSDGDVLPAAAMRTTAGDARPCAGPSEGRPHDDDGTRSGGADGEEQDHAEEHLVVADGLGEEVDEDDPQPVQGVEEEAEEQAHLEEAQGDVAVQAV